MESFRSQQGEQLEDYTEESYYSLLRRFPRELAEKHLNYIVQNDLEDDAAIAYLEELLAKRKEATTETVISDGHAKELFEGQEADFFHQLEDGLYKSGKLPRCRPDRPRQKIRCSTRRRRIAHGYQISSFTDL